jgi:hypothetical protein
MFGKDVWLFNSVEGAGFDELAQKRIDVLATYGKVHATSVHSYSFPWASYLP